MMNVIVVDRLNARKSLLNKSTGSSGDHPLPVLFPSSFQRRATGMGPWPVSAPPRSCSSASPPCFLFLFRFRFLYRLYSPSPRSRSTFLLWRPVQFSSRAVAHLSVCPSSSLPSLPTRAPAPAPLPNSED